MMRRRLLVAFVAAVVGVGANFIPTEQLSLGTKQALAAEEALPKSATGNVRVVFADAQSAGVATTSARRDQRVVRVFGRDPGSTLRASMLRWSRVPGVVSVTPEIVLHATTDYWGEQWDMNATAQGSSRAETAWSVTKGASSVVVAVLDTGRSDHPDLLAAMPAGLGVDMISNSARAGDDDGRDTDETDEGDWCDATGSGSSWHGTHVAGTIAAQHNDTGIRGVAPGITLLHVRVLGRCGGDLVDIADGIRWAAGLSTDVFGNTWDYWHLPDNTHPADVINLSLGGGGDCTTSYFAFLRSAIAAARDAGSVVVVAAGNEGVDVRYAVPAGCSDAFTVAATGPSGGRASYSNFGLLVDIAAPGGDISNSPSSQGILSTIQVMNVSGSIYIANREPTGLWGYAYYDGTSMATPHVSGAVALLRSVKGDLTVSEVESLLKTSARSFPSSCYQCGAGLLDIGALLTRSPQDPLVFDNDPPVTLGVGVKTTISITGGSGGGSLSISTSTPSRCSVSGSTITGKSAGTCVISVSKAGDATHFSAGLGPISLSVVNPPVVRKKPKVTLSRDKLTVALAPGTWTGGGSMTYIWYRCTSATLTNRCSPIDGASGVTYTIVRPSDVGTYIRATVTVDNGFAVTAWSNATAKIAALSP